MTWLNRLRNLFRDAEKRQGADAYPQADIFPDYISCPHCGEPEIEVMNFVQELRCHKCGELIEYNPH